MAPWRIVARRLGDGRVEFGVSNRWEEITLPSSRFFPADAPSGRWLRSSLTGFGGFYGFSGYVIARRTLGDRVEFGFLPGGKVYSPLPQREETGLWAAERVLPKRRFLLPDAALGHWFQSSILQLSFAHRVSPPPSGYGE